ncbi:tyrosine-type recombinase/integrase [Sodalis glossinidius]|uniref:tyrosine-type recombinase/integrase n=1 Tax=Sodalis glossinidius TaxID=63612 RepID=UPI001FB06BB0|nr:tyrosine-type recombinase/integrase [Sodalis glossinidius]
MQALFSYKGSPITKSAVMLIMHTGLRPDELVDSLWSDIDFEKKTWTIPAERMKKRRIHTVPLSRHIINIIINIKAEIH